MILTTFSIFSFFDCIEILFFSGIIYAFSQWLNADRTKPLLHYFYAYITVIICAHYWSLSTISFALIITAPGILALFTLMHQHTLQKNLIHLKNITITKQPLMQDSATIISQYVLRQINRRKDIIGIIECSDNLDPFIKAPFIFNAPLTVGMLDILCESPQYDYHAMIWISRNGILRSINALWTDLSVSTFAEMYESTSLHTMYTDALFFHAIAQSHTAIVIEHGNIQKNISMEQLHMIITKKIKEQSPCLSGGHYAPLQPKKHQQKHNP